MMRSALAFAFVLLAACSGKGKSGTESPTGSGGAIYAKKVLVSWGIQQQTANAQLFLQVTDETGKQVSHALGTYEGQCATVTPAEDMKAVIGIACKSGSTGVELHVVVREPDIVVLKMRVQDGVTPDPMSREEVTRVTAPAGAAIAAG